MLDSIAHILQEVTHAQGTLSLDYTVDIKSVIWNTNIF